MRTKHLAISILVGIFVLLLCVLGWQKIAIPAKWQEQYDLGIRYLSEWNYQEAIIAFTAAIEIDEKRPEAYLQAAKAYRAIKDYDAARAILEKGYTIIGDESLKFRDEVQEVITDNFITLEELTLGGVPFYETDIDSAYMAYPEMELNKGEIGANCISRTYAEHGFWVPLQFSQNKDDFTLGQVVYMSELHNPNRGETIDDSYKLYQPEFRNITIEMSMEETMRKLGFSEQGISELLDSRYEKSLYSPEKGIRIKAWGPTLKIFWSVASENPWDRDISLQMEWDSYGLSHIVMLNPR